MGSSCSRSGSAVEVHGLKVNLTDDSANSADPLLPPPPPKASHSDKVRRACVKALCSRNANVEDLYSLFGENVDRGIIEQMVSAAKSENWYLPDQVDSLMDCIATHGLGGFLDTSPKPKRAQKRPVIEVPTIENDDLLVKIKASLMLPGHQVVDYLHRRTGENVDHQVIARMFASAVEQTNDPEDQAKLLALRFQEMGLDKNLEGNDVKGTFTCPVCYEEKSKGHSFEFMCGLDQPQAETPHVCCSDCALDYIRSSVNEGDPNITCFQCKHVVSPDEIAQILGYGSHNIGRKHPLYMEIDMLKRDHAIGKDPAEYARCPTVGCKWIVARSAPGAAEKATCEDCGFSFCTNCLSPYHYRSTCAERHQLNDAWRNWVIQGRAKYWTADEKMRKRAQKIARKEKRRIEGILRVEAQDEQWKAENCRICPHCSRIVNKIDGCNAMRCGFDTDTKANLQQGCMQRFDWDSAEPYKAQHAGTNLERKTISSDQEKVHHKYWTCKICADDIFGLRFECVNCIDYTLCERCERDNWESHAPGHFFRIHESANT